MFLAPRCVTPASHPDFTPFCVTFSRHTTDSGCFLAFMAWKRLPDTINPFCAIILCARIPHLCPRCLLETDKILHHWPSVSSLLHWPSDKPFGVIKGHLSLYREYWAALLLGANNSPYQMASPRPWQRLWKPWLYLSNILFRDFFKQASNNPRFRFAHSTATVVYLAISKVAA